MRLTGDQVRDIVTRFKSGGDTKVLAKDFHVSRVSIYNALKRGGVIVDGRPRRYLDKDSDQAICDRYLKGEMVKDLAAAFDVRPKTIRTALNRNGIPNIRNYRKHTFDESTFDRIDTEAKAYLLGFLYADGCNLRTGKITIGIHPRDIDVLQKISAIVRYSGPIRIVPCQYTHVGVKKKSQAARLDLNSRRFSDRCIRAGLVHSKSLILKFPSRDILPDNLVPHFVRGYYDGDGSISFRPEKSKFANVSIIGSESFIVSLRDHCLKSIGVNGSTHLHKNGKTLYWGVNGNKQVFKFLDWLYKDATVFLNRKHSKYVNFCSKRKTFSKKHNATSRYMGVSLTQEKHWRAIGPQIDGRQKNLGTFPTEEIAAKVYDDYCKMNGINLNHLNLS